MYYFQSKSGGVKTEGFLAIHGLKKQQKGAPPRPSYSATKVVAVLLICSWGRRKNPNKSSQLHKPEIAHDIIPQSTIPFDTPWTVERTRSVVL